MKKALPKGKIELIEIPESEFQSAMQVFLPYNFNSIFGVGFIKKSDRTSEEWKFECDGGYLYIDNNSSLKFYRLQVTFEVDGNQIIKHLNTAQWDYAYNNGLLHGGELVVFDNETQVVEVGAFNRLYNRDEVKQFIKNYHADFILHSTMDKPFVRDVNEWFNRKTQKCKDY